MAVLDLNKDRDVLFGTLVGEADSETILGVLAVACTLMNRVAQNKTHAHFGDGSFRSVCLANMQYSCWNLGPQRDNLLKLDITTASPARQRLLKVADALIAGHVVDITDGATYYYAPKVISAPWWTPGAVFCGQFGTQLFWKGIK